MNITLRPARPADAEEMARWFVDLTDLAQWGGPDVAFPLTPDQLAAWIAEGDATEPRLCYTAVDERDRPIGHVQYLRDPAEKWARLGRFAIARERRGKGFGRAFFDRAVELAFTEFELETLALAVLPDNAIARRLYLSSGFRDDGRMPGAWTVAGKPYVMDLMKLTRDEWRARRHAPTGATMVA